MEICVHSFEEEMVNFETEPQDRAANGIWTKYKELKKTEIIAFIS